MADVDATTGATKRPAGLPLPAAYTVQAKHLKHFWDDKPDPVRPTRDQLKAIALRTPLNIRTDTKPNLYKTLQTKFPGKDVEGDPNARRQYEYYLRECGSYYADKNRERLMTAGERTARAWQYWQELLWKSFRVTQLAQATKEPQSNKQKKKAMQQLASLTDEDDDDEEDEEEFSYVSSSSASGVALPDTEQIQITNPDDDGNNILDSRELVAYEGEDDEFDVEVMPDSEELIATQYDQSSSITYNGDANNGISNSANNAEVDDLDVEELADDGGQIVPLLVVEADELVGDTPGDTESQSQSESQLDMVPNATSTQTHND